MLGAPPPTTGSIVPCFFLLNGEKGLENALESLTKLRKCRWRRRFDESEPIEIEALKLGKEHENSISALETSKYHGNAAAYFKTLKIICLRSTEAWREEQSSSKLEKIKFKREREYLRREFEFGAAFFQLPEREIRRTNSNGMVRVEAVGEWEMISVAMCACARIGAGSRGERDVNLFKGFESIDNLILGWSMVFDTRSDV
ncbi:hypothetical protein ACLOJK_024510 [Asimina triloba]